MIRTPSRGCIKIMDDQMEGSKMDKEVLTEILRNDGVVWDNDLLCLLFGCEAEKCENREACTVDWASLTENNLEPDKQLVCH